MKWQNYIIIIIKVNWRVCVFPNESKCMRCSFPWLALLGKAFPGSNIRLRLAMHGTNANNPIFSTSIRIRLKGRVSRQELPGVDRIFTRVSQTTTKVSTV